MTIGLTENQVKERLEKKYPYIIFNEPFKGSSKETEFKCLDCNVTFKKKPSRLINGEGCRNCGWKKMSNKRRKTPATFIEELHKKNYNIELLGNYVDSKTKIKYKCKKCETIGESLPHNLLAGKFCKNCGYKKVSSKLVKSPKKFEEQFNEKHPTLQLISSYEKDYKKVLYKCLKCNFENSATPSNLLNGYGCPHCNLSKGEKYIKKILEKNNIIYISQKRFKECKNKGSLPFDFYLPFYNCCIEYDGIFHFKNHPKDKIGDSLQKVKINDEIKNNFCNTNNIALIRINYLNWRNSETIILKELNK